MLTMFTNNYLFNCSQLLMGDNGTLEQESWKSPFLNPPPNILFFSISLHSSNKDRLSKRQHNPDLKSCEKLYLDGKGSSEEEEKRVGKATHPLSGFSLTGVLASPWVEFLATP